MHGNRQNPAETRVSRPDARAQCIRIAELIARANDIPLADLFADAERLHRIAALRHTAMYLAHVEASMTYQAIADAFGRDRTTVAYACARTEDKREDPAFDRWLAGLAEEIQAMKAKHKLGNPQAKAKPDFLTPDTLPSGTRPALGEHARGCHS